MRELLIRNELKRRGFDPDTASIQSKVVQVTGQYPKEIDCVNKIAFLFDISNLVQDVIIESEDNYVNTSDYRRAGTSNILEVFTGNLTVKTSGTTDNDYLNLVIVTPIYKNTEE